MMNYLSGKISGIPQYGAHIPPVFPVVGLMRQGGGFLLCEAFSIEGFLRFKLDIDEGLDWSMSESRMMRVDRLDVLDGGRVYLMHFTIEAPR